MMTTQEFLNKASAIKAVVAGLDCDETLSLFAMVTALLADGADTSKGARINWVRANAKLINARCEVKEGR